MVCSTDRSKAVVPVLVLLFVALWFILRGDLLYVFPCDILFLFFFSVLIVLRLPRLGKRELILVLFVRLFDLCLFRFVGFLFLLGSGKGFGLWLWHSLDFSLTFLLYTSGIYGGQNYIGMFSWYVSSFNPFNIVLLCLWVLFGTLIASLRERQIMALFSLVCEVWAVRRSCLHFHWVSLV